tara:strand:+ start:260 stop:667 length:408 start_codon:yes stop_codon:yes gene_type:complete
MSKKVKEQVSDTEKVKEDIQVVESEIHLLVYQVSDNEERILSSYNHKEDILFLMNEFSKSKILRDKNDIVNTENLKMISTSVECNFDLDLPSVEIRKQEMDKLFDDLSISLSEMEEPKIEKSLSEKEEPKVVKIN